MPVHSPDITVVIPCYNSEKWVARAISSVLAQDGVTVDVIVIDDGSTDGSLDEIRNYAHSIRWETGLNRGACAARNRGLDLAYSEYIMFLDADDYLEGTFLAELHKTIKNNSCDVCIGTVIDRWEQESKMRRRHMPDTTSWEALIISWLDGSFIPPCGVMWRTDFLKALGGWNESLKKNQDGELVLRAAAKKANFQIVSTTIGNGVYWQHLSPDRISNTMTPEKVQDFFSVYVELLERLESSNILSQPLEKALSRVTHKVECVAAKRGFHEEEKKISLFRLSRGWPRYEGSILHKLFCSCFGIGLKEKLASSTGLRYVRPWLKLLRYHRS